MAEVNQDDKQKVLDWMMQYCLGFRNARTRANILPYLQMPDRYLRLLMSELIHEGHLCSSASLGYWALPLTTKDREEIDTALYAQHERKSKALDLLIDCDKHIKFWEDKRRCVTQQLELNLV